MLGWVLKVFTQLKNVFPNGYLYKTFQKISLSFICFCAYAYDFLIFLLSFKNWYALLFQFLFSSTFVEVLNLEFPV